MQAAREGFLNRVIRILVARLSPVAAVVLLALLVACGSEATPTLEPVPEPTLAPRAVPTEPSTTDATERSPRPAARPTAAPPTEAPPEPTASASIGPRTVAPEEATATAEATVVAAGPHPTATTTTVARPAEPIAAATVRPPESTRTQSSPSATPEPDEVDIARDHPAALLAALPGETEYFTYSNTGAMRRNPTFVEIVEEGLLDFVESDRRVPDVMLPLIEGIGTVTIGVGPAPRFRWTELLQGDFTDVQHHLRQAAGETGGSVITTLAEEYRGVEIFAVVEDLDYIQNQELYLGTPEQELLIITEELILARETIDRLLDGGKLPRPFASMLDDWGWPDYLFVHRLPLRTYKAEISHLNFREDETAIMREIRQYPNDEQAAAGAIRLRDEPQAGLGAWMQNGSYVFSEATVSGEEALKLIEWD